MPRVRTAHWVILGVIAAISIFFAFEWPPPYFYWSTTLKHGGTMYLRRNLFTWHDQMSLDRRDWADCIETE